LLTLSPLACPPGRPGDTSGFLPVNSFNQPGGRPIHTSILEVLQRPLKPKQYVSLAFGQKARDNGITRSMGQVGTAYDNSVAETFFATLKKELIYRRRWPERQEMKTEVFDYIESFYNRRRRHSRLGWISPAEVLSPSASLPSIRGALDPEIVWAALDCPSFTPDRMLAGEPHMLGRLSVELLAPLPDDAPSVVVGWELGSKGRKLDSACALLSPEGDLLARSRAVWIALANG
jgi:hypothetical protein